MNWIKVVGIAAAVLVLGWVAGWVRDTLNDAAVGRAHIACAAAAGTPLDPLTACKPEIRDRIEAARRAAECDAALGSDDDTAGYAIRMTCSGPVKAAEQGRASAIIERDNARDQLGKAQAETNQAVARAEARAVLLADRKAKDDATIDRAPDVGDGRVRCDAECLRQLAEAGPRR